MRSRKNTEEIGENTLPEPIFTLLRQTYAFKKTTDCDIHLDVYSSEAMGEISPAVVWIHGGALIMGSREAGQGHAARYVDAGYKVISISYRLAPETKLPEIIADVRDAFGWIRSNADELGVDPARIGAVGHSAGGYLALMMGTFDSKPRALVSFYGYGDLIGSWYTKPSPFYLEQRHIGREEAMEQVEPRAISEGRRPGTFYRYTRQQGIWPIEVSGFDPAKDPAFFTPYCPDQNVDANYPPTLLLHGTDDTDVPYELSVRMQNRLKEAGVDHEKVTIEGGGHGFDGRWWDPQVKAAFARVLEFLDNHLN